MYKIENVLYRYCIEMCSSAPLSNYHKFVPPFLANVTRPPPSMPCDLADAQVVQGEAGPTIRSHLVLGGDGDHFRWPFSCASSPDDYISRTSLVRVMNCLCNLSGADFYASAPPAASITVAPLTV